MNNYKHKRLQTKAQAAMEFLMTYGWAILMVMLALAALVYTGVLNPMCGLGLNFQSSFQKFSVIDHKITGSDSGIPNSFYFLIKSKTPESFIIKRLQIFKDGGLCGEILGGGFTLTDKMPAKLIGGPLLEGCTSTAGKCYKYDTIITYTTVKSGLNHTDRGFISGSFESEQGYSFTPWLRTDFSGSPVKNENNGLLGSYNGICPAIPPSDTSGFITASSLETWDLPDGCNTGPNGGNTGGGFENSHCIINAQYLSHGWFTTILNVKEIMQGRDIYLAGNAKYYKQGDANEYSDGICINDNMYFYVNNELIFKGGTTGITNSDNILEEGEEVLRDCDGCYDIDPSGWCIPAVKLTDSSSFNYNGDNTIMVLVEDFCKWGPYPAGGLKLFRFYFI